MSDSPPPGARQPRAPLHLYGLGLLLLLWNMWGALIAITAQTGQMFIRPDEAAYYAAQPLWFVLIADIAPFAGVAGAVALLLQAKAAVWLFGLQVGVLLLATGYDLAVGTSMLLSNPDLRIASVGLLVLLAGQIAYARWLLKRGVLT